MSYDSSPVRAALDALDAEYKSDIAALNQQIATLQAELHPPVTAFGANASDNAEYRSTLALFSNVKVWRYYHQPNEPLTYPTEYTLGPNETFVFSGKVNPANYTYDDLLARFKTIPTDREFRFCVWHEPAKELAAGTFTKAEYDNAWAIARQAQQAVGNHIILMPILEGWDWDKRSGRNPENYLPDPTNYDEIGVDPYFAGPIGLPISDIPTAFDPFIATANKFGKKWGITEVGIGHNVNGIERLNALTLLSQTVKEKGATVCVYFGATGTANNSWSLSSAEAQAFEKGEH